MESYKLFTSHEAIASAWSKKTMYQFHEQHNMWTGSHHSITEAAQPIPQGLHGNMIPRKTDRHSLKTGKGVRVEHLLLAYR